MLIKNLMAAQQQMVAEGKVHPVEDFEPQRIDYMLYLETDGSVSMADRLMTDGNGGMIFNAPKVERSTDTLPALLWDHVEYVFGIGKKGPDRIQAFVDTIGVVAKDVADAGERYAGLDALIAFYESGEIERFKESPEFRAIMALNDELQEKGSRANIAFTIDGQPLFNVPGLEQRLVRSRLYAEDSKIGQCVVTGRTGVLGDKHGLVKGISGARILPNGGKLVSFNDSAFDSFGQRGFDNAPMLVEVTRGYHRGLNRLLADRGRHHLKLKEASYITWADSDAALSLLPDLHGPLSIFAKKDDLNAEDEGNDKTQNRLDKLRSLLNVGNVVSLKPTPLDGNVHVVKLRQIDGRIAEDDYVHGPATEIFQRALRWYEDLDVVQGSRFGSRVIGPPSIKELVGVLSGHAYGGSAKYWDVLRDDLLQASLHNKAVSPEVVSALYVAFTRKYFTVLKGSSKDPQSINVQKFLFRLAGLSRLILIRNYFYENFPMSLDTNRKEIGYNLGRLMAAYEYIQRKAIENVQTTVMNRVRGALDQPRNVFNDLAVLNVAHLSKLRRNGGGSAYFEKLIGSIYQNIDGIIPLNLRDEQRQLFIQGYWHQNTALYTAAPKVDEEVAEAA